MEYYDIGQEIWKKKYRFNGNGQTKADVRYEDTWGRIAKSIAAVEKDSDKWEKEFYSILENFRFLPAGRIISNAGTSLGSVTMFNCYVMNTIDDSMEGIFDTVKNAALTQKQGGGVGFDFSTIRPAGDSISGCNTSASGPISFMQVLDATCRTIMSAGQRRGAQMAILRCDHPDVESFIEAKRGNEGQLKMFNLSVAVTEDFIAAVKSNSDWQLVFGGHVYKTVKAADLWEKIMKSTYDYAEPGVFFVDQYNKMNNLYYCEDIRACNPCGEQGLPPYGACLLGSINLTQFVKNPFKKHSEVDFVGIEKTVATAVRMLDNVIDISNFPLSEQRDEANQKRRMGLGITGLADAFIMLGVKYGSPKSMKVAGTIMENIRNAAYRASVELAKEKGAFPLFDEDKYVNGEFIKTLPEDLRNLIREHGIRNSHLTSIAPTGTISLLAGNVSSGLEPVFAINYSRRIRNTTEEDVKQVEIDDYAYLKYLENKGVDSVAPKDLPEYFITSSDISTDDHLEMQSLLQKYVDSSISKTINIPTDYPFDQFKNVYMKAYESGCKGCTTFRPSEHITGVLVKKEDKKKPKNEVVPAARPKTLSGTTYKIQTPMAADSFYVTINDIIEDNGDIRPYEVFINTKNLQHFSWIVAMTRLISAVFRNSRHPEFLVQELKSVYDPNGGYFSEGAYVPSLAADIGRTIELHLEKIGIIKTKKSQEVKISAEHNAEVFKNALICPMCNEKALIYKDGCMSCMHCDYSKCS